MIAVLGILRATTVFIASPSFMSSAEPAAGVCPGLSLVSRALGFRWKARRAPSRALGSSARRLLNALPTCRPALPLVTAGCCEGLTTAQQRGIGNALKRFPDRLCAINCARLPKPSSNAEALGHARGAFTGAGTGRTGLFEGADGTSLFFDEVRRALSAGAGEAALGVGGWAVRRSARTTPARADVRRPPIEAIGQGLEEKMIPGVGRCPAAPDAFRGGVRRPNVAMRRFLSRGKQSAPR